MENLKWSLTKVLKEQIYSQVISIKYIKSMYFRYIKVRDEYSWSEHVWMVILEKRLIKFSSHALSQIQFPFLPPGGAMETQGPPWPWGLGDVRGEPLVIGCITLRKVKSTKGQPRHPESLWLRPVAPALGPSGRRGFERASSRPTWFTLVENKNFLSFPI